MGLMVKLDISQIPKISKVHYIAYYLRRVNLSTKSPKYQITADIGWKLGPKSSKSQKIERYRAMLAILKMVKLNLIFLSSENAKDRITADLGGN